MDEINPYAPPKSDDARPAGAKKKRKTPAYKLYTPGQIALATFLGTPVAGMFLLSVNRRRMGKSSLATTTLLGGIGVTVLLFGIGLVLPESVSRAIPIGVTIAAGQYARVDQPLLDAHVARGGQKESSWKAAGFGLAGLAAIFGMIMVFVLVVTPG